MPKVQYKQASMSACLVENQVSYLRLPPLLKVHPQEWRAKPVGHLFQPLLSSQCAQKSPALAFS